MNNDPEYVEVYSLPIGLSKLFRNCSYLEYPALGKFPDAPRNGYVSGGADLGDLLCPCWCEKPNFDTDENVKTPSDDSKGNSQESENMMEA